jgi:hypothetical protein
MKVLSLMTVAVIGLGMVNLVVDNSPAIGCTPTRRGGDDSKGKPHPHPSPSPSPSFSEIERQI